MADSSVKKALTLRAASIGDTLMGKYFLENVHAAWPNAKLTLLVGSRVGMIKDLFAGYPWLTVVEVNRKSPVKLLRAWRELRGQDLTLTQYAENPFSFPSKLFARLVTKRGGLLGFTDSFWGNRFLYDEIVPFEGEEKSGGMIIEEQKALTAVRIPIKVPRLQLSYIPDTEAPARFGLQSKQYVVAHLFSGNEGRSISQQKRISLVKALRDAMPEGYLLALTGVTEEYARAEEAKNSMSGVINLAGKTTLQELINLLAEARSVLALDSGAAHITAHLETPLVVLTRTAARQGWWSEAMYGTRPTVLSNLHADDTAPRAEIYPPSLETIDLGELADIVNSHLR
ncbi:MAG: glycosyltransferase family 9 protein [Candidatus Pacebacteria bacterium]|nr:glycosyltransferase family 9 protein [Candidatus Paceibacterota bacterium]